MQGHAGSLNWRPPTVYKEPPTSYLDTMSYQRNTHRPQFKPSHYTWRQPRHSPAQQEVPIKQNSPQAVRSNNADACVPLQRNPCRYDGQIKQTFPPPSLPGHQQNYRSSHSDVHLAQFKEQACSNVFNRQNYRNTDPNMNGPGQPPIYWTQHSDHLERSRTVANDNTKTRSSHISDIGRSCFITNQQQPQTQRPANLHHQLHQHSGHQQTPLQPNSQAQNVTQRVLNYQYPGRPTAHHISHNAGTLPPAGPVKNISPPSKNVHQSRPEMRSYGGPEMSAAQSENNQSSTVYSNSEAHIVNQSCQNQIHQKAPTDEGQFNPTSRPDFNLNHYIDSKLYEILFSEDCERGHGNSSAANTQQSGDRVQNTSPGRPGVPGTNRTGCNSQAKLIFSRRNLQSVFEPPRKRMKDDVILKSNLNKPTKSRRVCEDYSGLTSQSVRLDTHQTHRTEHNSTEKRHSGMGQSEVTYSTDPVDCLEAVYALQKAFQQANKAVAVVPPISQQTKQNTQQMDDGSSQADSPPLKIDTVWSLAEVCASQNPCVEVNDKLTHAPSPALEKDNKISSENKTVDSITGCHVTQSTETCAASPTAGPQYDALQRNHDSSDTVFELSSVPVDEHTLEELMELVKLWEMIDSSAGYVEKPESVCDRILDLYWNGSEENLLKNINALEKVMRHSAVESVKNDKSVVFESVSTENLKKVANCVIVDTEVSSWPEEFTSSWLNDDEPLLDDITQHKRASKHICVPTENPGLNSNEQSVKAHTERPGDDFTPSAGSGRRETDTQIKGHSDAELPAVAFLSHANSQRETSKKQNLTRVNTKPADLSSSAGMSSEELKRDITTDVLNQEHVRDKQELHLTPTQAVLDSAALIGEQVNLDTEKPHDSLPVSDSPPAFPGDKPLHRVSTVSDSVRHFKDTEPHKISTNTRHVEDISEDERDNSMVMSITVCSPDDALKLFQQFEKEPRCDAEIVSTQSDVEPPEFESPLNLLHQPNPEPKAKICSRCGRIVKLNSTHVNKTHNNNELLCSSCWDTAPSLDLEMEPHSPKRNETDVPDGTTKLEELEQNHSPPSLEPEESCSASAGQHNTDEAPTEKPEEDNKSVPDKMAEIQSPVEQTQQKSSRPTAQLLTQHNKPQKSTSGFFKCKLKSGRARISADDSVLFAPDIVLKKRKWPQKHNHNGCQLTAVSATRRPAGGSQNCSGAKNTIKREQTRPDRPLQAETDTTSHNREKVREKVSCYSTPLHQSKHTAEADRENQTAKTMKTNQGKKVTLALYGSKSEHLCVTHGRRFSAPAILTVSTARRESDEPSARQKVHHQWSSMFISNAVKSSPPKLPQKKKKMQKPHEVLKSNMVALKKHLKHRVALLSNSEKQKH